MSKTVIRVERAGKRYAVQPQSKRRSTPRLTIAELLRQSLGRSRNARQVEHPPREMVWALRDVSFEVKQGENLAVVGRNGAGKSTLLKLLAGITAPTEGWTWLSGRVGTLFSLGTGFHQEMSGRDNVYMNGVALGMSTAEVRRKFDAIVAFSELEQFIDTPVKFYSSGMMARLGFSVFAHFEPEILLIDEALSAGDISFRNKAAAKLAEISRSGVTTVFVSHNLETIRQLCDTGVLLQKGRLITHGPIAEVLAQYEATSPAPADEIQTGYPPGTLYCREEPVKDLAVVQLSMLDEDQQPKSQLCTGNYVRFRLHYLAPVPIRTVTVALTIQTRQRVTVVQFETPETSQLDLPAGRHFMDCIIPQLPLNAGIYQLGVWLKQQNQTLFQDEKLALVKIGRSSDQAGYQELSTRHTGLVLIEHHWETLARVGQSSAGTRAITQRSTL